VSIALVDDHRRIAEAYQDQVQHKSTGSTVAIKEGVNLLKAAVKHPQRLGKLGGVIVKGVDIVSPSGEPPRTRCRARYR
ncbi:MAG: hypothetical protein OXB90_07710, partial [Acidimicrobiaceae bacterium]|nr:hypothetical protein [Acidimicrobiaceae bacterium]